MIRRDGGSWPRETKHCTTHQARFEAPDFLAWVTRTSEDIPMVDFFLVSLYGGPRQTMCIWPAEKD